jgi:hypothetical protein
MTKGNRRGVMLFAVIVVLAVAALAVGALNVAQEAEHAGQVASQDQSQQRAVAWSGAQALAAALAAQRELIAAGEDPVLPAEMVLWEADGRTALVRLLPVGPLGEVAVSETAKRSLALLNADQLALTGVVNAEVAAAALKRRDSSDTIEGLVDATAGLSPSVVLGPVVSTIAEGVRSAQEGDRAGLEGVARPLALADVVTPFQAQQALGERGVAGLQPRTVLHGEWTPDAHTAIDEVTAAGVAQRLQDALQGKAPADASELVTAMIAAKVEPAQWSAVLEAVICNVEPIEVGRVDLGRASEAVLRSLPGVSAEKATRLVQERQSLTPADRMQVAWPVVKGVLTPEEFAQLAPHICARSWLWRLRLVSGMQDHLTESETLQGVQVWDVVVDLAEDPPRFASIRDSTLLPVAVALAAQFARERQGQDEAQGRGASAKRQSVDTEPELDAPPATQEVEGGIQGSPRDQDSSEPIVAEKSTTRDWRSLGETAQAERAARRRADEDRRAKNREWSHSPPERADAWERLADREAQRARQRDGAQRAPSGGTPASVPDASRSDDQSASDGSASGRRASDAPSAHTPTGGLSGRWRTRESAGR